MRTGAARRGLRPSPHRSRRTAVRNWTVFTGHLRPGSRETGATGESASRAGNCDGVRSDRSDEQSSATETCWSVPGNRGGPARQPGSQETAWQRSSGSAPKDLRPTQLDLSEDGSDWHQDRWHGQPGQRESVTTGSVAGNRYRNRKAASPATPQGETGDVLIELKANARRSTSGGSVRLRCPGGCAAQAAAPPGLSAFSAGSPVPPDHRFRRITGSAGSVDEFAPVLVSGLLGAHGSVVHLGNCGGHRAGTRDDTIVDRVDRADLGRGATHERLVGDVQVAAGDVVDSDLEAEITRRWSPPSSA